MSESMQREMHDAICSECGAECQVPFKPTEGKPVMCRECFGKKRSNNRSNNFSRPQREMHDAVCSECGTECQVPFKPTEGKPVMCRDCFRKSRE
ncbi:MAG: CxxC-x17-CxxC domain-containing protein [Nanoarchaeota archaeon]